MSLINQMLRDLDRRDAERGASQVATPPPVSPLPDSRRRKQWVLWVLPLVAGLLVALYVQPWNGRMLASLQERPGMLEARQDEVRAVPAAQPALAPPVVPRDNGQARLAASATATAGPPGRAPRKESPVAAIAPVAVEERAAGEDAPVAAVPSQPEAIATPSEPDRERTPRQNGERTAQATEGGAPTVEPTGQVKRKPGAKRAERVVLASADGRAEPAERSPRLPADTIKPVDPPAEALRVSVQKVAPEAVQESAAQVYASALIHLEEGQPNEARAALRHCLALDRTHAEARHLLAMLLLERGARREAVALLDAGLKLLPGSVPLAALRGRLLMEEGDLSAAARLLDRQRAVAGDEPELLSLLGSAYQQLGRYGAAVEIYRRLSELQPDNARALAGLAIALDATGDQREALSVYRTALNFDTLPIEVSEYARKRVAALSGER